MKTQEVQFGGNNYPCRVVESNEGEELLIGSITLLDALQPGSFNDENEGFASKEAERIYDEVFFFTDMANLRRHRRRIGCRTEKGQPGMVRIKNNNHLKNSIVMEKRVCNTNSTDHSRAVDRTYPYARPHVMGYRRVCSHHLQKACLHFVSK